MESIREGYEKLGVFNYYIEHKDDYKNPHFDSIKYLLNNVNLSSVGSILDLCSGGGEVTSILKDKYKNCKFVGCDPYLYELYERSTGFSCLEYSFKEIHQGVLSNMNFDIIICSFALHLCDLSMLDIVLYQLSLISDYLIIITPHKRPEIKNWWYLISEKEFNRVHLKVYKKILY